MGIVTKGIVVFLISILELTAALPVAVATGLPPIMTTIITIAGACLGVLIAGFTGEKIKAFIDKRKKRKERSGKPGKTEKIKGVLQKYGPLGLGLIGPITTGALIACALGVSLGASRTKLMAWLGVGVVIWTIILTIALYAGVAGVTAAVS